MATIKLDLSQFKSSGIYTLEFDASESVILNTQTVRLIVGFSRKGPFNAPTYLPDQKTARTVFGDIDPFLERRGAFFHRAIYTALEKGPVFALNLMALNNDPDDGDKVPYQSFSICSTEKNGKKVWCLYSSFYNKERFWKPDADYLLGNVNEHPINKGKLLNIVNLGQTPVSVIIKKGAVKGFDITAREFYGVGKVPSYIDEWDFISDYHVEVTLIEGAGWNNYTNLSVDPVFSEYFDIRGLKKGKYNDFLSSTEVNKIGTFVGSLIPDLVDGNGVTHSIDVMINNAIASTNVFVAINKEALENYDISANLDDEDNISAVDVIGHNFANPERENPDIIDYLSYRTTIKERLNFLLSDNFSVQQFTANPGDNFEMDSLHLGRSYGYLDNILVFPKPLSASSGQTIADDATSAEKENCGIFNWYMYNYLKNNLIPGQSLIQLKSGKYGKIEKIYEEVDPTNGRTYLKMAYSHPNKATERDLYGFKFIVQNFDGNSAIFISREDITNTQIATFENIESYPQRGQFILLENKDTKTWYYVKVKTTVTESSFTYSTEPNNIKSLVKIELEDDASLDLLAYNSTGFRAYFKSAEYVDHLSTVNIVAEPSVFKFVPGNGTTSNPNYFVAYKYSKIYDYFENAALLPGDKYYWGYNSAGTLYHYLNYEKTVDSDGISILKIKAYDTYINDQFGYDTKLVENSGANIQPGKNYIRGIDSPVDYEHEGIQIYGIADNLYDPINVISWNSTKTSFQIKPEYSNQIEIGHYIVAEVKDMEGNSRYKLTKVNSKIRVYNAELNGWAWEYTVNQSVRITENAGFWITRYYPMDDFIKYYQIYPLEGFKLGEYHLPGGTNKTSQLEKILGMLDPVNSNLMQMLKESDQITFRYVVDTFDGGLSPMMGPKVWLSRLAMQRQKCLAILNAPAIKEFIASNTPRFTEEKTRENPKPVLNTAYIATGGNLSLSSANLFSLPDENNGAKFTGVFSPFLRLYENGKTIDVPPAAHVSNLFVDKFIKGTPFAIVAGPRRGVISESKLVGLEYEFLQLDRDNIEPMGINPIIKKKNVGYMIYANQMAYQRTNSAFNNLHVRDLLITIEDSVEQILSNYMFEFNDSTIRLEIKTTVEMYLDGVRSNGGIYNFSVIMDESNNTSDIIDRNMGVLDIIIEPARGIHKFINRITVQKTGGVSSGGFTFA